MVAVAAALCVAAAGCGGAAAGSGATAGSGVPAAGGTPAAGDTRTPAPAISASPDRAIAWVGHYSANDGRSVDPQNGYGSPLTLKLALSTLKITRRGDRYVGVIATPSLADLPPNTLAFQPTSNDSTLLAKPAPLTRITLHALSADSFSYVVRARAGGVWTLFSRMTFVRIKSQS
jgi:hypothetical protein